MVVPNPEPCRKHLVVGKDQQGLEPVQSLSCSGSAGLVQHPWGCSEMLQEHRLLLVLGVWG